jgi:hypothetical protein
MVLGLVFAAMIPVLGFGAEKAKVSPCCETVVAKDFLGVENPADSPLDIRLVSKAASLKEGLQLAVTIKNVSDKPYEIYTCPNMQMCRVRGLHPMIAFDETGMGLLDVCKDRTCKEKSVETRVAAKGEFNVDLTIPADRLPKAARVKDKEISVFLCFKLADGRLVHSNVAKVALAE